MLRGVVAVVLLMGGVRTDSQTAGGTPYSMRVTVDEVSATFHAADAKGLPVGDLKANEVKVMDNGQPPRKVVDFRAQTDMAIHAGILMDMSPSMAETRANDRGIAMRYAEQVLRQSTDAAFVVNFDLVSKLVTPWTHDVGLLEEGIRNRGENRFSGGLNRGTAIFDAIYGVCLNEFAHADRVGAANFILLFSDGEDNASHATLKQAVDMCQGSHTAIYAFRPKKQSIYSDGPPTLLELAAESGGRVFQDDGQAGEVDADLREIEGDLRDQYRVVYRPQEMKRDGSFHRVEVTGPDRVERIAVRSGYYAPSR